MSTDLKLLVVIPAYNEEASISSVVSSIKKLNYDVVVVNDASKDNTAIKAKYAGAKVLDLHLNLGAWNAMQTGMRYAVKNDYDVIVTMDADGQHDAGEIQHLVNAYQQHPQSHVVSGACPSRGSVSKKLTWKILRFLSGSKISDITSGFRLYDKQAMLKLVSRRATSIDYQDIGILLLLSQAGLNIIEVEVKILARSNGQSKIFGSWFRILYYLYYSFILTTSKSKPLHRLRN